MEKNRGKLGDLGVLAVLALMAVCLLLVLLTGAGRYRSMTLRGGESFASRTAALYLTTRIRQADRQEAVRVEDFDGAQALSLREQIGESWYVTRVYCYDGWLRELFTAESGDFSPEDGEKLMELSALSFSLEEGLLTAELTQPDGSCQTLTLWLRGGKEAP